MPARFIVYVPGRNTFANGYACYCYCIHPYLSAGAETSDQTDFRAFSKQTEAQKHLESNATTGAAQQDDGESQGPWKGLQYRLVGPFRGGRVVAVAGVVGQDDTYYFGSTAGGVWKTTDGGLNWKPIFDKTKDASPAIGAIAVSESDPNVIYVGTGEA